MKKNFFIMISCLAFLLLYFLPGYYEPPGIPVLSYHKIEDNSVNNLGVSVADFERQMRHLFENGYTAITPEQLYDHLATGKSLRQKSVLITFDDGYVDNYTYAYPILKKYGFQAMIFLVTDEIGRSEYYLNWEQIREMNRQGGIVFGSHTLSHVDLTACADDYAVFQLTESNKALNWWLQDKTGKYFAYPGGFYNGGTQALVQNAGYLAAFSTKFGRVSKSSDIYALERIPVLGSRFAFLDFYLRLYFTPAIKYLKVLKASLISK